MKRPSFQFYPADWRSNAKLRRCSDAARGAWMDILCLLHDSDDYGIVWWPLIDLARAAGVALKLARELADKDVLKGSDNGIEAFTFTPTHSGKAGETVTLIPATPGPCWYCSRFVRDEWIRQRRGAPTQFTTSNQPPKPEPKAKPKRTIGATFGDGPTSSSSSSSAEEESSLRSDTPALPAWLPKEAWDGFLAMRRKIRAPATARAQMLLIKRLDQLANQGHDPTAVLDQSTQNSWKGLFAIKQENSHGHRAKPPSAHDKFNAGIAEYIDSLGPQTDGPGEGDAGGDAGQARLPLLAS